MKLLAENGLIKIAEHDDKIDFEFTADHKQLSKQAHDLAGAIAGLKFIVKAVKSRYEFTAEEASDLGESAEKALATLETEAKFLMRLYGAARRD